MPPKKKTTNDVVPLWLLIQEEKSRKHHIIHMDKIQNPTKKKHKTGDVVCFTLTGDRSDRMRGSIITMGDKDDCTRTLTIINDYTRQTSTNVSSDTESDSEKNNDDDLGDPPLVVASPLDDDDADSLSMAVQTPRPTVECRPLQSTTNTNVMIPSTTQLTAPTGNDNIRNETTNDTTKQKNVNDRNSPKSKRIGTVSMAAYCNLERKCAKLEKENRLFRTEWMPKPKNPAAIDWLVQAGKILSGQVEFDNDEAIDGGKGERLARIMDELPLDEKQLEALQGSSITSTCRRIVAALYPPDRRTAEVHQSLPDSTYKAIRDYARIAHPVSAKSSTDGQLNAAINNVFAVHKSKKSKVFLTSEAGDNDENQDGTEQSI